jgi:NADH dehydrogenase [ubiquinone] 1 alpha subcomplex assembly factor 7
MVDSSSNLREKQHELLCGNAPLTKTEYGWESHTRRSRSIKVIWVEDIKFIPDFTEGDSPFFIAHEFFDALPIHAFQSVPKNQVFERSTSSNTDNLSYKSDPRLLQRHTRLRDAKAAQSGNQNEWRELMVSNLSKPSSTYSQQDPEFELSRSNGITPHSTYLPTLSDRYSSLLPIPDATIEISPDSLAIAADLAKRIGSSGRPLGAALIIDYGTRETVPANTLRGIRSHKLVSPFSSPGLTDLSASVDFLGLAHAALDASPDVEVFGPTSQTAFLTEMGIEARGTALENAAPDEQNKKRIRDGWNRLADRGPRGMGLLYNAMAIVPRGRSTAGGVVGFGGNLAGESIAPVVSKG